MGNKKDDNKNDDHDYIDFSVLSPSSPDKSLVHHCGEQAKNQRRESYLYGFMVILQTNIRNKVTNIPRCQRYQRGPRQVYQTGVNQSSFLHWLILSQNKQKHAGKSTVLSYCQPK